MTNSVPAYIRIRPNFTPAMNKGFRPNSDQPRPWQPRRLNIVQGPGAADTYSIVKQGLHRLIYAGQGIYPLPFRRWVLDRIRASENAPKPIGERLVFFGALEKMAERRRRTDARSRFIEENIAWAMLEVATTLAEGGQNEDQELRRVRNMVTALDLCGEATIVEWLMQRRYSDAIFQGFLLARRLYLGRRLMPPEAYYAYEICGFVARFTHRKDLRRAAVQLREQVSSLVDWNFREFKEKVKTLSGVTFAGEAADQQIAPVLASYLKVTDRAARRRAWTLLGDQYLRILERSESPLEADESPQLERELNEIAAILLSDYPQYFDHALQDRYAPNRALVASGCARRLKQPDRSISILQRVLEGAGRSAWVEYRPNVFAIHRELMFSYARIAGRMAGREQAVVAMEEHFRIAVRTYEPGLDPIMQPSGTTAGRNLQGRAAMIYLQAGFPDMALEQVRLFEAPWPVDQAPVQDEVHLTVKVAKIQAMAALGRWKEVLEVALVSQRDLNQRPGLGEVCRALSHLGRSSEIVEALSYPWNAGRFTPLLLAEAKAAFQERRNWQQVRDAVEAAETTYFLNLLLRTDWPDDFGFDDAIWPAIAKQAAQRGAGDSFLDSAMAAVVISLAERTLTRAYFRDSRRFSERASRWGTLFADNPALHSEGRLAGLDRRIQFNVKRQLTSAYVAEALRVVAPVGRQYRLEDLLSGGGQIAERLQPKSWSDSCGQKLQRTLDGIRRDISRKMKVGVSIECAPLLMIRPSDEERLKRAFSILFSSRTGLLSLLRVPTRLRMELYADKAWVVLNISGTILAADLDEWQRDSAAMLEDGSQLGFEGGLDPNPTTVDDGKTLMRFGTQYLSVVDSPMAQLATAEAADSWAPSRESWRGSIICTYDTSAAAAIEWLAYGSGPGHPRTWVHNLKSRAEFATGWMDTDLQFAEREAVEAIKALEANPAPGRILDLTVLLIETIKAVQASPVRGRIKVRIQSRNPFTDTEALPAVLPDSAPSVTASAYRGEVFCLMTEELLYNARRAAGDYETISVSLRAIASRFGDRTRAAVELAVENPVAHRNRRRLGIGVAWIREVARAAGGKYEELPGTLQWRTRVLVPRFAEA